MNHRWPLAAILLLALALRLPMLHWGLPSTTQTLSTYHPDEATDFFILQNWNPHKLQFHPGQAFWWGTLHLYLIAGALETAVLLRIIHPGSREFLMTHLAEADRLYL